MAKIKQEFTGDFNQIAREYDKLLQKQVKMEQQLGRVQREADKSAAKKQSLSSKSIGNVKKEIGSLAKLAASYASIQAAVSGLNAELEKQRRFQREARNTAISLADAESRLIVNLGDKSDAEKSAFIEKTQLAGLQAGLPANAFSQAVNVTISATGDEVQALETAKVLAPLFRTSPEDLPSASEAAGNLVNVAGRSEAETVGLVLSTMSNSQIKDLSNFNSIPSGINAAVATQENIAPDQAAREGAVLIASLSRMLKDSDGARSRTTGAALASALERNFKRDDEKFNKLIDGGATIVEAQQQSALSLLQRLDKAQDVGDRVAAAQRKGIAPAESDLAIQKDLLRVGFGEDTRPIVRNLLAGNDTKNARDLDIVEPSIGFNANAIENMTRQVNGLTTNLKAAKAASDTAAEKAFKSSSPEIVNSGTALSEFEEALNETGYKTTGTSIGDFLRYRMADINQLRGVDPVKGSISILDNLERSIQRGNDFGLGRLRNDSELSDTERKELNFLRNRKAAIMRTDFDQNGNTADRPQVPDQIDPEFVGEKIGVAFAKTMAKEFGLRQRNRSGGSAAAQLRIHDERD